MQYYFGSYYLVMLKKLDFGSYNGRKVFTCSTCLNDSLYDSWSLSWTNNAPGYITTLMNQYGISKSALSRLHEWADEKFNAEKLGWPNTFSDLETLNEYRSLFFSKVAEAKIIKLYFPSGEAENLLDEFKPHSENLGKIGLYQNLEKRIPETEDPREKFIGYDIIGIEVGDFHSFHCHDTGDLLCEKFGLTINGYGLIDHIMDHEAVLAHMNSDDSGYKPVPWFIVKVKLLV